MQQALFAGELETIGWHVIMVYGVPFLNWNSREATACLCALGRAATPLCAFISHLSNGGFHEEWER